LLQVADIAMNRGSHIVQRITIEVGPLSGVEPALLASAFAVLRAGGCAAQALLSIETPAVTICCLRCDAHSCVEPNRLVCSVCGDFRTRLVSGDELRLRRVELQVSEALTVLAN
jgi:hydrogenase nickel incorporation protein HypA/HybF